MNPKMSLRTVWKGSENGWPEDEDPQEYGPEENGPEENGSEDEFQEDCRSCNAKIIFLEHEPEEVTLFAFKITFQSFPNWKFQFMKKWIRHRSEFRNHKWTKASAPRQFRTRFISKSFSESFSENFLAKSPPEAGKCLHITTSRLQAICSIASLIWRIAFSRRTPSARCLSVIRRLSVHCPWAVYPPHDSRYDRDALLR